MVDAFTRFFYSTLLPAVVLVPWWFRSGRYLLLGGDDWVETDNSEVNHRALPGIIIFFAWLYWWERPRIERPLPEVALGLWGIYLLQLLVQVFYVVVVTDEDNKKPPKEWSVACKAFPTLTTTVSNRIALGMTIDVWIVMGATALVSYWTPYDTEHVPNDTTRLIQYRMKQSIQSNVMIAAVPLWYTLGHLVLGSGGGGVKAVLALLGQALLVVLPFQLLLWHRERHHIILPKPLARMLLSYYGLHFLHQFVAVPDGVLEHYLHLSSAMDRRIAWCYKGLLFINMLVIMGWSIQNEEEQQAAGEVTTTTAQEQLRAPLLVPTEEGREGATDVATGAAADTSTVETAALPPAGSTEEQPSEEPLDAA